MKIIFLGTNGWYDTGTGNTISTLIDSKAGYIILDAGNGIYKATKYIKEDKPVYLFLSHFHIDHIEGLHTLVLFKFKDLKIIGQPGTKETLKEFLAPKYSVPLERLPYKTEVIEVDEGEHNKPFKFKCLKLKHVSSCFGFRFEIEDKIISYCTDTGYCKEAVELSEGADLAILECAFESGQEDPDWPHLNPEIAANMAKEAGAKKLALTHFDAYVYQTLGKRKEAEEKAKGIFKNSSVALDDLQLEI